LGVLVGAAAIGSVATIALWGGNVTSVSTAPPPVTTAPVVRTDLATTTLTEGTLGYAPTDPVVNRVAGTYTALPAPGQTINPGDALYRVDNLPVVLMAGTTPAWRSFAPGMADGPDVGELQHNLVVLGDAVGLFTAASNHFSVLTTDAVKRWQSAHGYPPDGQIPLGQVVFLPGPVLVGAGNVDRGQSASPGDIPFRATTTTRVVTVPLNPSLPSVGVGDAVTIVLPSGTDTTGRVTGTGPAPSSSNTGQSTSGGQGSSGSADQSQAATVLVVTPDHPTTTGTGAGVAVQVSLTTASVTGVLAVPVAALLALAGGGYGIEVVGPARTHHLVAVRTGMFTGSQVQINALGIEAGTKVVVAQ
jgi:hypothetical protein